MMQVQGSANLRRYLPHVLIATFAVTVLPLLIVTLVQASDRLGSPLFSIALAMLLSIGAASAGSAFWMRHPGSKDLVFGDLMIWGWIRRLRAERRLSEATELLGIASGGRDKYASLTVERKAEALEQLAAALEARDTYSHGHTRRVTRHAHMIAKRMGLSPEWVAKVRSAAAVHDVGKIKIPREILNKPGKLNDEEFAVMKRHASDGADMATAIGDPVITAMVRHHHERLDGTGYPDGLAAEDIPLGARIIAVADTFDAITSTRPYRAGCKHKKAIEILKTEAGTQLDPDGVRAFMSYYSGRRPLAWWFVLTEVPQRLLTWLGGAVQGASAAPITKAAAIVGAATVLGGSGVTPALPKQSRAAVHVNKAVPAHAAGKGPGYTPEQASYGLDTAAEARGVNGPGLHRGLARRPGSKHSRGLHLRLGAGSGSHSDEATGGEGDGQDGHGPKEHAPKGDHGSNSNSGSKDKLRKAPDSTSGPTTRTDPESGSGSKSGSNPRSEPKSEPAPTAEPDAETAPSTDSGPGASSGHGPSDGPGAGHGPKSGSGLEIKADGSGPK